MSLMTRNSCFLLREVSRAAIKILTMQTRCGGRMVSTPKLEQLGSSLMGFPCGSAGKEFACDMGDLDLTPGLGRSPGEGKGYPLQYSGLENSLVCVVHGVAKSWTQLSNFHSL